MGLLGLFCSRPRDPLVLPVGLHYDALAVAAYEGAPESLDVTMVPSSGQRCDAVMAAARALTAAAHKARAFTDTANFTLRQAAQRYFHPCRGRALEASQPAGCPALPACPGPV